MYFSAYLAEEIMGGPYTVAPGCVPLEPVRIRCNFNDFMMHIWGPMNKKEADIGRPRAVIVPDNVDFSRVKLATLVQFINNAPKKVPEMGGRKITMNIDAQRLFPGSLNYYDAVTRCSAVIQNLRAHRETLVTPAERERCDALIRRAQEAINWVVDLRGKAIDNIGGKDYDGRLKVISEKTGTQGLLSTKRGRDTTKRIGAYQVWDIAETFNDPHLEHKYYELQDAWDEWYADPKDDFM